MQCSLLEWEILVVTAVGSGDVTAGLLSHLDYVAVISGDRD